MTVSCRSFAARTRRLIPGRTLTDLILKRTTPLTRLPWANHRSPLAKPEPLRFVGANLATTAMEIADAEERLTGRPSIAARLMRPLTGH